MTVKISDIQDARLNLFARENCYRDFAAWQSAIPDETDQELEEWFRSQGMELNDPGTWQYAEDAS